MGFITNGFLGALDCSAAGSLGASFAASKLKTDEVQDTYFLQKNINEVINMVSNTLHNMGELLNATNYSSFPIVAACIGSGLGNLNPTVVCIEFLAQDSQATTLYFSAYAKEGLIKQNTAKKAIEQLKAIFSQM